MLTHYGVPIGLALVVIATATAIVITARAARSIEQVRHEDHELFDRKNAGSRQ